MNSSAEKASRKWANGTFGRIGAAMVTAASALLMLGMPIEPAFGARASRAPWDNLFRMSPPKARGVVRRAAVPLPKPRPAEAPAAEPAAEEPQAAPHTGKPTEQAEPAPKPTPQPPACRLALTEATAIAPSIPDIKGAGGCGGEDLVRLEAIVLPDERRGSVKPAAILRCPMASPLARGIRNDIPPLAGPLANPVSDLDHFDSFHCPGAH